MVGVAQLVRVSDCGPEGRGFDPLHPPRKRDCSQEQSLFLLPHKHVTSNDVIEEWPSVETSYCRVYTITSRSGRPQGIAPTVQCHGWTIPTITHYAFRITNYHNTHVRASPREGEQPDVWSIPTIMHYALRIMNYILLFLVLLRF